MGSRGPAPTPTSILHLRGSWRAKTRSDDEIKPKGKPICPSWILPEAKKYWRKIIPALSALGLCGEIDGHILARYCQMYAQWRTAQEWLMKAGFNEQVKEYSEEVQANGKIIRTPRVVGLREWPQVRQARSLHKDMCQIERRFGMDPSARASMAVEEPKVKKSKQQHVKEVLTNSAG